eukprot:Em0197g9a
MVVKSVGKPLVLTKLTTPSIRSSIASAKTVKRRVQYLAKEIRSSTVEERSRILDELTSQSGCRVSVSTEESLAMKANLIIPWNKIRVMRRWLKAWGIQLASEQKMRQRASALIGTNMSAEMIPLLFKHKGGADEIKPAPIAYIPHLWARIQTLLEQNDVTGVDRLTWHNGVIPADELWVKIGGDKAIYSGQDSFVNLKICLERYAQQLADIEAAALVTKRELMDEMVSLKDTIQCFEQHVVYMLSYGEEEMDAAVELMKLEIEGKKQRLNVVGEEIDKLEVTLKVDFKKEDGPFVKALDNALASFHVKRQAYYSGTFVGNHVHRALKANNVAILCNSIVSTAEDYPPLCSEARAISQKYLSLFNLFQKCHNIYDKNIVSDEEIEQLEDSIGAFMAFYRKNFATHSVLPKMHFLEVHVVPYLKQWHMGFGFLGEQGVESIHHYFNDLERTYCGVRDPAQKLQLMLKEHTLHTAPSNVAARPEIKRRKRS